MYIGYIVCKWAQEDVNTLHSRLNNSNIVCSNRRAVLNL
jgi:hypothetical protein